MKAVSFLSKPIKRILSIGLSLCLLLAAVPAVLLSGFAASSVAGAEPPTELTATYQGSNLITNSSFDSSSLSFWNANSSTGLSRVTDPVESDYALRVNQSWSVFNKPNTLFAVSDSISGVTGGATYEFSAKVYNPDTTAQSTAYLVLTESTGTTTWSTAVQGTVSEWTKISGIITLDAATTSVTLAFYFKLFDADADNEETWYMDDISLYRTTEQLITASDTTVNTTFDSDIKTWMLNQQLSDSDLSIPTAAYRRDTTYVRSGAGSLYFGKDAPEAPVYLDSSVKIPVEENKDYTWGLWYTSHDSTATARLDVLLYDSNGVQTGVLYGREFMLSRADTLHDWKMVATTEAMPSGTAYASYRLHIESGRAQIFVDDVFGYESTGKLVIGSVTAGETVAADLLTAGYTYCANMAGSLAFTDLNGNALSGFSVIADQNFTVPSTAVAASFTPASSGMLEFEWLSSPTQDDAGWTAQVAWYPEDEPNSGTPKLTYYRLSFYVEKAVRRATVQLAAPNNIKGFYLNDVGGFVINNVPLTGDNATKRIAASTADISNTLHFGNNLLATAAYHSGDANFAGLIAQIDVEYTDGTVARFGTGLSNTVTTTSSMVIAAGDNPDIIVQNNQSANWYATNDTSGWIWKPAQMRGTPPFDGKIGSVAYNWAYDLFNQRAIVSPSTTNVTVSGVAGEKISALVPYTDLKNTPVSPTRVRLFIGDTYYATSTMTVATETDGAADGNGLLKLTVDVPDYLPTGNYLVRPYHCDLDLLSADRLLNINLTASGKTAGIGKLTTVTVAGADTETVENAVDSMVNGGFENGSNNWSLSGTGATVVGSSFAQDGEKYGVLDRSTSTATAQLYCNQFAVQPNTEYTLSFWKYSEVATQTYYTIHCCNSSNGIITSQNGGTGFVATDGWQQITRTFTTTADTAYLRIDLSHNDGASQAVSYVDNVSVCATADPSVNLLPNGSFENGMSGWASGGAAPASVATSPATHSGNGMLKLEDANGSAYANSYLLNVNANATYTLSYWQRTTGAPTTYVNLHYVNGSGSYSSFWNKNVTYNAYGWTLKTHTFTTAADTKQVRIDFNVNAGSGGVVYVDDVTLTTTVNESVGTTADKTVLTVNGMKQSPVMYLRTFGKSKAYYDFDVLSAYAASGVRLYATFGGMLGDVSTTGAIPVWNEDGSINTAALDEDVYEILDVNPNAMVLYNIDMDAPDWWKTANPNECFTYTDATGSHTAVSWASTAYRNDAVAVLQQIVNYLYNEAPYRHRLFGIRFTGGSTYEWITNGTPEGTAFDSTAAMVAAVNAELGGTSYTANQIRTAITSEGNIALLNMNSENGRIAYAYNRLMSQSITDSILAYADVVKTVSGDNWLAGAYNGYLWNFTSSEAIGSAHTTVGDLLESDLIDFIASPVTYGERTAGHYPTGMALSESVQAHGKLYFLEQDNRTLRAAAGNTEANSVGKVDTLKESVDQLTRDLAIDFVKNNGWWTLDMEGGWFSDAAITERIGQIKSEYDLSLALDTGTNSEIAVVIGDDTYDYFYNGHLAGNSSKSSYLLTRLYKQQRIELAKLGTSYDTYAVSDVNAVDFADYKLTVVISPFGMTAEQANAIKAGGGTVLWIYLPGHFGDGTSLTDYTLTVGDQYAPMQATYGDYRFGTATYGTGPKVTVDATGATVLADYIGGTPAVVSKAVTGTYNYTSVYSAVPAVPAVLLRQLADEAGVHRYTEDKDAVVESNNSYLTVTALYGGEKTVTLPKAKYVYNVLTGENYGVTDTFTVTLDDNQTAIFRVTDEAYTSPAATPSDHGGDDQLPAGAVNLLTGGDFSSTTASGWNKSGNFATTATIADGMLSFANTTATSYLTFNTVNLIPGATYTYSLYYWVTEISNTQVDIRTRVLNGAGTKDLHIREHWITKLSDGWNRLSVTFTIPADTTETSLRVWLYNAAAPNSAYPGTIYYDDVSLICEQHYVGIDSEDENDVLNAVYYNVNMNPSGTDYSRDNVVIDTDSTLPLKGGVYSYTKFPVTLYDAGTGTTATYYSYVGGGSDYDQIYMYTAESASADPSTTPMKEAANGSIFTIPAGSSFTYRDTTVYFVQDFVLTKSGNTWTRKVTVTDHTTAVDGGRYIPDGMNAADDIFMSTGELTAGAGGFTLGNGGSNPTGSSPIFADGIVSAEDVTGQITNANYWFIQTPAITVEAGATYQLSYYIWVTDATSLQYDMYVDSAIAPVKASLDFALNRAGKTNVKIGANYYDLTASSANTAAITAATDGWKLVTYTWEAAQSGTGSFYLKNYGSGPSTYYIDDVALYQLEESTVEFEGATATLSDRIHLNFHVSSPKTFALNDELKVKFTYTGRKGTVTEWVNVDTDKVENGNYVFPLTSLVAAYMATEITAEVGVGTTDAFTVKDSMTYSVREYGDAILTGDYAQKYKDAASMMLNYGAWAQQYFGYNEEDLANSVLPEADRVSDTATWLAQIDNINQYKTTVTDKLDSFVGYTLLLQDGTALRIYFNEQVTATVDGAAVTAVKDGDSERWYIEIAGVGAADLDVPHTVVINDTMTISNLSALTPARTVANSDSRSENFRNMCISLILYAQMVNQL